MINTLIRPALASLISAILLVTPAFATPPRYASVSDVPIAASQTHIYVLRTVDDNEGSHYIRQTVRFLVAQNLETGVSERHWPLGATREDFVEPETPEYQYTPAVTPVDILKILAEGRAAPVSAGAFSD